MVITPQDHVVTNHGHGTLYLLTGRYERYDDAEGEIFAPYYEPRVPTLFEYFRRRFAVAPHEALLINSEDRPQEEFLDLRSAPSLWRRLSLRNAEPVPL